MAVIKLQSLVLSGYPVPQGGKAVNPRRRVSCTAYAKTSEIHISMRQPLHASEREFPLAARSWPTDTLAVDSMTATGAGRSLRRAGVIPGRGVR